MNDGYILKSDVLKMLALQKNKWQEIKGNDQDVTVENFIDNVMLTLDWVISDIEKMGWELEHSLKSVGDSVGDFATRGACSPQNTVVSKCPKIH